MHYVLTSDLSHLPEVLKGQKQADGRFMSLILKLRQKRMILYLKKLMQSIFLVFCLLEHLDYMIKTENTEKKIKFCKIKLFSLRLLKCSGLLRMNSSCIWDEFLAHSNWC